MTRQRAPGGLANTAAAIDAMAARARTGEAEPPVTLCGRCYGAAAHFITDNPSRPGRFRFVAICPCCSTAICAHDTPFHGEIRFKAVVAAMAS